MWCFFHQWCSLGLLFKRVTISLSERSLRETCHSSLIFSCLQCLPPPCLSLGLPSASSSLPPHSPPPMPPHSWNQVNPPNVSSFQFVLSSRWPSKQQTACCCCQVALSLRQIELQTIILKTLLKVKLHTIRGDLEKVKKHLKKNDVNSVDGQGRWWKDETTT